MKGGGRARQMPRVTRHKSVDNLGHMTKNLVDTGMRYVFRTKLLECIRLRGLGPELVTEHKRRDQYLT
ncbi:hypothetical protein MPTK1_4g14740 [Marchantia polymorpha subsp. ruderalis]|uniref:Uncharacterized protein n=2 Tax=Marchantia polymorpha TaxID=3197 RepID=A0AAF6B9Y7_MARPO|nr:hypothetical protein MARPO_0070s0007 [Marchantia polymorpha]BBN08821.1 hypothetical protein Mp_4g14740 [Marchantia polymorpha subsp. ruderalis]|eukprot:PTQ35531.1 hypothetical protein MARPO_0070s0007 [Marchantia polymorpha]